MAPRKKSPSDIRPPVDEHGRLVHARHAEELTDDRPDSSFDEVPEADDDTPHMTGNQLVAYNLQRARKARGWSQEVLGVRLSGMTGRSWSKASVSAAESSWRGGRVRRFDANEILAFARALSLPVAYFLLPPDEDDLKHVQFLVDTLGEVGVESMHRQELLALIEQKEQPADYVDRLKAEFQAVGVEWTPANWGVSIEIHGEAAQQLLEAMRAAGLAAQDTKGQES